MYHQQSGPISFATTYVHPKINICFLLIQTPNEYENVESIMKMGYKKVPFIVGHALIK